MKNYELAIFHTVQFEKYVRPHCKVPIPKI